MKRDKFTCFTSLDRGLARLNATSGSETQEHSDVLQTWLVGGNLHCFNLSSHEKVRVEDLDRPERDAVKQLSDCIITRCDLR
ncbi:MAG: hypothetical protein JKY49_15220 [Cohaesibacteraceae bacterium]|nr:hypothetical protein [Cohaesibacteraceae bacterium]